METTNTTEHASALQHRRSGTRRRFQTAITTRRMKWPYKQLVIIPIDWGSQWRPASDPRERMGGLDALVGGEGPQRGASLQESARHAAAALVLCAGFAAK